MPSDAPQDAPPSAGAVEPRPAAEVERLARPQRLHVVTPIFLLIRQARQLVFLLAIAAVQRWWGAIVPLLGLGVVWVVLEWWRRTWTLDGEVLRIEEGVLGRKLRVVPVDRIQQVDIRRRLVHRLLGVASLRVETGGGTGGSEVELDVLSLAQASALRETLLARRSRARGGTDASTGRVAAGPAEPAAVAERVVARLTIGQVILAGVTSARAAAALAVIGPIIQYADDLHIDVIGWVVDRVHPERVLEVGVLAIATAALTTIVVWFVLAAGAGILIDYGFTMAIKGGDLVVRRGLLERREITMPLARVQVVRVGESWVRRLLGMATIQVFSGGTAGNEHVADRVAIPILPVAATGGIIDQLLPGAAPLPRLVRPPLPARRRAIVRAAGTLALPGAILGSQALWSGPGWPAALAWIAAGAAAGALLGVPFGIAAWRARGHAWQRGRLFARNGVVVRWTSISPAVKAQSVRATSTPFQRRAGLASLHVDVAGASPNPTVVDERASRAEDLLRLLVSASRRTPAERPT
jgi:putative membrane protein